MESEATAARIAELRRIGLLGSAAEERFDRITRLAQNLFRVDFAVINFVSSDSIVAKSSTPGPAGNRNAFGEAFCDVTVGERGIVVVPDTTMDPRFAGRPAVTDLRIRFYAGVPLKTPAAVPIGTLCIVDTKPRDFGPAEQDLLVSLSKWAEREIEHSPAKMSNSGGSTGAWTFNRD